MLLVQHGLLLGYDACELFRSVRHLLGCADQLSGCGTAHHEGDQELPGGVLELSRSAQQLHRGAHELQRSAH